jgi:hypothetical protein
LQFRVALAASVALLLSAPAAMAQSSADMTAFSEVCLTAEEFLLGQLPEGTEAEPVMIPLCTCLTDEFSDLPQADVDMLTTDLRGEGTEDVRAAYGDYEALSVTARGGVTACFANPDVVAAIEAAAPPAAAEPEPEAAPQ